MRRRILLVFVAVLVAGALAARPAWSAVITAYTDRTAWEAAIGGVYQTETFDGVPLASPLAANTTHDLGLVDFSYTGAPSGPTPGIVAGGGGRYFIGDIYKASSGGGTTAPGPHVFTFPCPVTGFGADFGLASTNALLTVTFAGQTANVVDYLPSPGTGFLGFTATETFTTVTFDAVETPGAANEAFDMDDLSFSNIPEPATLSLLALGGLALLRRRRK